MQVKPTMPPKAHQKLTMVSAYVGFRRFTTFLFGEVGADGKTRVSREDYDKFLASCIKPNRTFNPGG